MRRVLLSHIPLGQSTLPAAAAHHLRDVLRLEPGESIEVFDAVGNFAAAKIISITPDVRIQIDIISAAASSAAKISLASALPKGQRADWMIEKLAELGVDEFIPLQTERSIVLPKGQKFERWQRLAESAAEQSGRAGVMRIAPLVDLPTLLIQSSGRLCLYLAPAPKAPSILRILPVPQPLLMFIGPEGGWTDSEVALFQRHNVPPVRLTATILRIETAAIVAASIAVLTGVSAPATITPRL